MDIQSRVHQGWIEGPPLEAFADPHTSKSHYREENRFVEIVSLFSSEFRSSAKKRMPNFPYESVRLSLV